mgnify:CR=1 FL=1
MTDAARQSIDALTARVGGEARVSHWHVVDQARIDAFASATDDHQFIHVDPVRALAETPFGGTIAHGFLSVSLLPAMLAEVLPDMEGRRRAVNYGFDRLRFVSPVRAGARVRGHFALTGIEERKPGEITATHAVTVEIEGAVRPALVAEWITRYYFDEGT